MSLKTLFTCGICKDLFIDPAILPCSNTICKSHLINEQKYNCHFCKVEHDIPLEGFKENLMAKHIINNDNYLTPDEKRIKNKMQESCLKLDELVSSYELKFSQTETKLFDHFSGIKTKIDLKREELKLEIDNYANSLIEKVKTNEKNLNLFMNDIKSNDNNFSNSCLELKQSFKVEFSKSNIDNKILEQLVAGLDKNINEIKEKFSLIESIERENLKYQFKSSIEKIDISSVYGSVLFSFNEHQTIQNRNLSMDQKSVKKTFADKSVDCDIKVEEAEEIDPSDEDLFEENTLISCSDDQTIRIWDLENDTCVKTLKERGPIDRIYEAGGKLISISNERFLKIWDLKTGELQKSFKAFDDIGQFIFLSDDKFVISVDRDIFVWSLKDNSYCMLRDLHNSEITCLEELSENILITGANDNIIKVWKLNVENRNPKNKSKCIKSYGHSSRINSLLIINKSD